MLGTAVIVADESNYVDYAYRHAADLLGREGDKLIGQRLTVMVPPHREAHLAGYTRCLLASDTTIMGPTVRVLPCGGAARRSRWN